MGLAVSQREKIRNPKQQIATNSQSNKSQIGKIQNTESAGSWFGILYFLVI
jgi:hypothetical protein